MLRVSANEDDECEYVVLQKERRLPLLEKLSFEQLKSRCAHPIVLSEGTRVL